MPVTLTGTVDELKAIIAKLDGATIAQPKSTTSEPPSEETSSELESTGRRGRRRGGSSTESEKSEPKPDDPGLPTFTEKPSRLTQKQLRGFVQVCTDRWGRDAIAEFWKDFEVDSVDKLDNKDYLDAYYWFVAYDLEKLLDIVVEKKDCESVRGDFFKEYEIETINDLKVDDFEEAFKWLTSLYKE